MLYCFVDGGAKILHKEMGSFTTIRRKLTILTSKKMSPQRMPFIQEGATVEEKAFHYK